MNERFEMVRHIFLKNIMKLTLIGMFMFSSVFSFAQSGDEQMNKDVKALIHDLKMDDKTKDKFIEVYKAYGTTMKKAVDSDVSGLTMYYVYINASSKRDKHMKKILSSSQYKLYHRRQKEIDDRASKKYREGK